MSGSDRYSYRRMGSKVIRLACLVLLSFFACFAVRADEPPAWSTPDAVVQQIAKCLHDGKEVVMGSSPKTDASSGPPAPPLHGPQGCHSRPTLLPCAAIRMIHARCLET